jgi:outer membrane immunogenic protein
VFGVSVDGNWADIGDSKTFSPAPGGTQLTLSDNLNWYGTLQTRAGIVVDNLMLYATGGVALANIEHGWSITDPASPRESFSADSLRFGGVGGIGTELAWGDHWTIKSETLYFIFDEKKTTGFSPAGNQNVEWLNQDSLWVSRMSLNYKFDSP